MPAFGDGWRFKLPQVSAMEAVVIIFSPPLRIHKQKDRFSELVFLREIEVRLFVCLYMCVWALRGRFQNQSSRGCGG